MTPDLNAAKRAARALAVERRARLHSEGYGRSRMASGHALQAIGGLRDARVVAAYLPMRTEIDPRPAMLALLGLGYRVGAPVIDGADRMLRFRSWTPEGRVFRGPFGTPSPAEGDWLEPDVILAPLLAYDRDGWRLGYGGGYYDRTLAELRAMRPVRTFGFAFAGQRIDAVPHGGQDMRLDAIITEKGVVLPPG